MCEQHHHLQRAPIDPPFFLFTLSPQHAPSLTHVGVGVKQEFRLLTDLPFVLDTPSLYHVPSQHMRTSVTGIPVAAR